MLHKEIENLPPKPVVWVGVIKDVFGWAAPKAVCVGAPNIPVGWVVVVVVLPNIEVLAPKLWLPKLGAAVPVGLAPNEDWPNPEVVVDPNPIPNRDSVKLDSIVECPDHWNF